MVGTRRAAMPCLCPSVDWIVESLMTCSVDGFLESLTGRPPLLRQTIRISSRLCQTHAARSEQIDVLIDFDLNLKSLML